MTNEQIPTKIAPSFFTLIGNDEHVSKWIEMNSLFLENEDVIITSWSVCVDI